VRSNDWWKVKLPDAKEQVSSPCKRECKIEGVCCTGCGRHQDDIRMWLTYSEEKRKRIMKNLGED
jgi:predicted Fe-S protein YdhL (DUF1289 family)